MPWMIPAQIPRRIQPMDHDKRVVETLSAAEPGAWNGVEENTSDPEEVRVIFSALDSFA